MKNRTLTTFLLLLISACSVPSKTFNFNQRLKIISKEITPDFEMFDDAAFETEKEALLKADNVIISNYSETRMEIHQDSYTIKRYDKAGNLLTEILKSNYQKQKTEYFDNYLGYGRLYYKDGKIYLKGIGSWLGFSIGKKYFFNDTGELMKVEDTDDGYAFDYHQVFQFCDDHDIKLVNMHRPQNVSITKSHDPNTGRKFWAIESPIYQQREYDVYLLDGNTGALINNYKRSFGL